MNTRPLFQYRWFLAVAVAGAVMLVACGSNSASERASSGTNSGGAPESGASTDSSGLVPFEAGGDAAAPAQDSKGGASSGGGGASLPAQLDRKIIQVATLTLSTDKVSQHIEDVGNIAASAGGYVASSTFGNDGDRQTASITIKVPGGAYQDTVVKLRRLGEVTREDASSDDQTEQYTDLQSRLRNLQATEAQYLQFLGNAANLNEVLTLQDRINLVRADIEQVQGRIDLLAKQTDFATITVHLTPPIAGALPKSDPANNPLEVAQEAFDASLTVLLGIATVAFAVAAFSWWLLPLVAVGVYVARKQSANRRQA
jgi:hypothetical protein